MSPHIYINFFWKSNSVQFSKPMGPHIQGHFALWHLQAGAGQEGGYPMGWPGENWGASGNPWFDRTLRIWIG